MYGIIKKKKLTTVYQSHCDNLHSYHVLQIFVNFLYEFEKSRLLINNQKVWDFNNEYKILFSNVSRK